MLKFNLFMRVALHLSSMPQSYTITKVNDNQIMYYSVPPSIISLSANGPVYIPCLYKINRATPRSKEEEPRY